MTFQGRQGAAGQALGANARRQANGVRRSLSAGRLPQAQRGAPVFGLQVQVLTRIDEVQYVGRASLARGESTQQSSDRDGKPRTDIVPATIDIVAAKEEMRVGDRLLPEPPQQLQSYVPHAPQGQVEARIVSVYGNAVINAGQNQVVVINRGSRDGMESGHVMAILKNGARLLDKTDPTRPELKLPDERNGLLMVFRTFEKLSYALVLEITDGVKVGDRLVNPR